jgi:Fe-S cluster assembly iron-binding protein IscA
MDAIEISPRAADTVRQMIERSQRLQESLQTFVEALGAQLDVPQGWRFDTQTLTFVPPVSQPEAALPLDE